MTAALSIQPEPPDTAEAEALLAALDAHLGGLYAPEHCHGLSVAALQNDAVTFLVARWDGVAVGCGAVLRVGDEYAEVKRMYVAPPWRGRNVAQALLEHLERVAQQNGSPMLRLETGIHQRAAMALYERRGFVRRKAFGDYTDNDVAVCYEKTLAPAAPTL